jgi:predicted nucleotide-binding protein
VDVALFVSGGVRMTGIAFVESGGLLEAGHATQRQKHLKLNENVLIEIGAALALYRRNVILLVHKGVTLPSNLQGLYKCYYEGQALDYDATMKLLKAFNDFAQPRLTAR